MLRAIVYAAATALLLATGAAQAAWPERSVTVVTPYAAGGIADVVARLTAERLQSKSIPYRSCFTNPNNGGIVAYYEQALRIDPNFASAHNNALRCRLGGNDVERLLRGDA